MSISLQLPLFQALEISMKDRKKDLEDLLAHSIELQRRQQLTPQEKVPILIYINKERLLKETIKWAILLL